jgi:hypothetical protein
MASAKDTFESHTFRANTFASGNWRGVGPAVIAVGTTTGNMRVIPRMSGHLRVEPRASGNLQVEPRTTEGLRSRTL